MPQEQNSPDIEPKLIPQESTKVTQAQKLISLETQREILDRFGGIDKL